MVKILQAFVLVFFSLQFLHASVDVSISSPESDGTPITLRFVIKDEEGDAEISNVPDDSTDWRISPPITQTSKSYRMDGLKMESQSTTSIVFYLQPLKVGQLKVPLIQIKINDKTYSAPQSSVRVTALAPKRPTQRPRQPIIPGFPVFPMDDADPSPQNPLDVDTDLAPKKLDVSIIAEPSKVEVYAGELIVLPFYIYTNENIFRNLEFASFPTFKDFIKEELYLPKNWRTERVKYRGANYYKAEIIRFAIFPLKEGELLIDPLNMRFEIDDSLFSLRKHFPNSDDEGRPDNNFLRSSGSVPIKVLALPLKPANIPQSEIAVGKYTLQLMPPNVSLTQNEAFVLKIRVEGQGNIKGIPEPEIILPEGLQKSKTETDYSVNTLSEGYKDFDLLLVPRKSGSFQIPEQSWAFFNPDKKIYELLKIPSVELKVRASVKGNTGSEAEIVAKELIYSGKQSFETIDDSELPLWAWGLPALIYILAGVLFIQRRRHEQEERLISNQPWILIERKILAQHDLSSNEALGLVEEWILRRFQVLNLEEASFDELTDTLRKKVPASSEAKVERLKEKFRLIESTRFGSGKKTNTLNLSFMELKKLTEEIIQSSISFVNTPLHSEEDDD